MRPPNAPPGLPQHPVPSLCGTPGLYTNRHAVSYFTALLCGIPLSRPPGPDVDQGILRAGIGGGVWIGGPVLCVAEPDPAGATVTGSSRSGMRQN